MRHARSSLAQTIPAQAPQRLAKRITAAVRSTQQDDLPRVAIRMAWNANPSQFRSDFENLRVSHRRHSKEENPQARGAATCDSKARSAASFSSASGRKIIQTPTRTKQAPRSDQADKRSPPSAQPSAIAPGGVISEIVCNFVTDISGISQ